MYCRNCGNEVNDKAVACPKCGVNPRTEKNFCPSCGNATQPNQVLCTSCGVSLQSASPLNINMDNLPNIDISSLADKKYLLLPLVGVIAFFMNWIKASGNFMGMSQVQSYSGSKIGEMLEKDEQTGGLMSTILSPFLLWLFPLCMAGVIVASFLPQLAAYKKYFTLGGVVLALYAGIGIFTTKIKMPEVSGDVAFIQEMAGAAVGKAGISFTAGFGFYFACVAAVATAYTVYKNK